MRHPGKVVSKTMIVSHIWDYSFDTGTNAVDVLVHRLRDKIDKRLRAQAAAHRARGRLCPQGGVSALRARASRCASRCGTRRCSWSAPRPWPSSPTCCWRGRWPRRTTRCSNRCSSRYAAEYQRAGLRRPAGAHRGRCRRGPARAAAGAGDRRRAPRSCTSPSRRAGATSICRGSTSAAAARDRRG